jgi:hypothetical protein
MFSLIEIFAIRLEGSNTLIRSTHIHRAPLAQGYHIEKQIFERSDLDTLEADLDAMLKTAGGANYDMGS